MRPRGAPRKIRTSDNRFRRPVLYPAELWALGVANRLLSGSGRHWYDLSGAEVNVELRSTALHPNRSQPTTRKECDPWCRRLAPGVQ